MYHSLTLQLKVLCLGLPCFGLNSLDRNMCRKFASGTHKIYSVCAAFRMCWSEFHHVHK